MHQTALADFEPLSSAERTLIAGLGSGTFERLGDGTLPKTGDAERNVRADLLRFCLLGGGGLKVHEKGVRLTGALVTGTLDLEGCRIPRDIGLLDCRFDAPIILRSAVIDTLFLDGSVLPGLFAERLEARGDINMRGLTAEGPIYLPGARIGGSIRADAATLRRPGEVVLNANGMETRGNLQLRGASLVGRMELSNARLGADFVAVGARFEAPGATAVDAGGLVIRGDIVLRSAVVIGTFDAVSARIDGDLDLSGAALRASDGTALALNRATVGGAFILRDKARVEGLLGLTGTRLGVIADWPDSWPRHGDLDLDRCLYDAFIVSPVDAGTRLDWLARQYAAGRNEEFFPQPYEQLAAVLRRMGHEQDANRVLFEKERLQRRAARRRTRGTRWLLLVLRDWLLRVTVGYGRQSLVVFVWLTIVWIAGGVLLQMADNRDAIRPNAVVALRSPEWLLCAATAEERMYLASVNDTRPGIARPGQSQIACWRDQPEASGFPKFNALIFSADTILPALDTGQRAYWSPDTRDPFGRIVKQFTYFSTIAGWALSLLAVAGFTGLVRSG